MAKINKNQFECRDYQPDWNSVDKRGNLTGRCLNCGDKRENHDNSLTGAEILREIIVWLFLIGGTIFLISFIR
jgi:hypothetical protein